MKSGHLLSRAVVVLQAFFDAAAGAVLATVTLVVLWGVFTRFALSSASWWTDEAARFLLLWLTMLGSAAAAGRSEHLGVDFFAKRLHPDAQRAVSLTVELTVVAFAVFVLVFGGAMLVFETLHAGQRTPAIGLPMGIVYLAAPVAGIGITLFSLERVRRLLFSAAASDQEAAE